MIDFGEHADEKKILDMTPMLDVVFLLLIFLMLTSIFAKPMLPLNLPQAATGVHEPEPEVTVFAPRGGGAVAPAPEPPVPPASAAVDRTMVAPPQPASAPAPPGRAAVASPGPPAPGSSPWLRYAADSRPCQPKTPSARCSARTSAWSVHSRDGAGP